MLKARKSNLFPPPARRPPNVRSFRIAAVAAVKLFEIEELKESQAAAASQGRRPHAAACDSFSSSILKSLPAATASIRMDQALGAGVAGGMKDLMHGFLDHYRTIHSVGSLVGDIALFT